MVMKTSAGLWIDHRKALIVFVSAKGESTQTIESHVEKQQGRFEGVRSTMRHEAQLVPADDRQQSSFTGHLNEYYDKVAAAIRDADSVLIFGPGEAKGELKRRIERRRPSESIVAIETADKMTDREIAAKVRKQFP